MFICFETPNLLWALQRPGASNSAHELYGSMVNKLWFEIPEALRAAAFGIDCCAEMLEYAWICLNMLESESEESSESWYVLMALVVLVMLDAACGEGNTGSIWAHLDTFSSNM